MFTWSVIERPGLDLSILVADQFFKVSEGREELLPSLSFVNVENAKSDV